MVTQEFPIPSSPIVDPKTGCLTPIWVRFFLNLWIGTGGGTNIDINDIFAFSAIGGGESVASDDDFPSGAVAAVTVGASPSSYEAINKGSIWIAPGTYAGVSLTRGTDVLSFGKITRGIFPVSRGDIITVTYDTLTPTIYFIPA